VSSEAVGYEKERAYDDLTWDYWKPDSAGTSYFYADLGSAKSVDAWGMFSHNLGTNGASVLLQYSSTGAWAGEEVDVGTAVSPTATEPVLKLFTSVSARYWRFKVVSASVASSVGGFMLGARLTLAADVSVGFTPDSMAQQYESTNNLSETTLLLGISTKRKPHANKMSWRVLDPAWNRTYWLPFLRHAEQGGGFLFLPLPDDFPNEVVYGKAARKIPTAAYTGVTHMRSELPYIGITF